MVPNFIKKSLVALIAVLTFGTVIPTFPTHYVDKQDDKEAVQKEKDAVSASALYGQASLEKRAQGLEPVYEKSEEELIADFSSYALIEAKDQGLHKFGSRVTSKIGSQYVGEIAPAFADAVRAVSAGHDKQWIRGLAVTHSASAGNGERILHVYQTDSGRELLKLHVRRDHPPLDGYWFDFHYHTALDGFQRHHELKRIYWGKDMPPKWQA